MKVLLVNGSSHEKGCTYTALQEIADILKGEGIESEIVFLGNAPIRDCIACGKCRELETRCIFNDDIVNSFIEKAKDADAFVFGSPVYYSHPSGRIQCLLDRCFFSSSKVFAHKPGATIVSARRAGTTSSFDVLNKYFSINQMPIVTSTYWNNIHGSSAQDAKRDLEGLQTMRNLARNMAWMLKCIELGKENGIEPPKAEREFETNFMD